MSDSSKRTRKKSSKKTKRRRILLIVLGVIVVGVIAYNFFRGSMAPLNMESISSNVNEIDYETTDVALVQSDKEHVDQLTEEDVREMVFEAVELAGGLGSIVSDGDVVVLKTNFMSATEMSGNIISMGIDTIGSDYPEDRLLPAEANGISTDWRVTKAVAELVRELNPAGKIYVMEGSGVGDTDGKMKLLKYTPEYIPYVDEFISLDESGKDYVESGTDDLVAVDLGSYKLHKDDDGLAHTNGLYYYDKTYYEADVIISIPVLKNHQMANITGAIKNVAIGATPPHIYGSGNGGRTAIDHSWEQLNNFIHDHYLGRPVDFVVTDGLQSIEHGPLAMGADSYESVKKNLRVILAGIDAVAVDTVHGLITGVDTSKVEYLNALAADGIGITDVAKINVVGNRGVYDVKDLYGYPGAPYSWMQPVPRTNTYEDFEGPAIDTSETTLADGVLTTELTFDEEVVKVEVSVNGEVVYVHRETGASIQFELANEILGNSEKVELLCYDQFLNMTKKVVE